MGQGCIGLRSFKTTTGINKFFKVKKKCGLKHLDKLRKNSIQKMPKFLSVIQVKTSINFNKFISNLLFLYTLKPSESLTFVITSWGIQWAQKRFIAGKIPWKFYATYQINVFRKRNLFWDPWLYGSYEFGSVRLFVRPSVTPFSQDWFITLYWLLVWS